MENVTKYPKYKFLNAKAIAEIKYPNRMTEDLFLERAYYAWKMLPNKNTENHVFISEVNSNNKVTLPDNVEYIISVTTPSYFYQYMLNNSIFLYSTGSMYLGQKSKEWEAYRLDKSKTDRFGGYITYELEDGAIYFPQENMEGIEIAILYEGLLVDENCDPLLYEREVQAIADHVIYSDTLFKAGQGDPISANMLPYYENKSTMSIMRAGMPERITDNELDQILNVQYSNDRKVYNRNYKFRH